MKPTQGRKSLVGGSTSQPPTLKPPHSNSSLSISNLASPKVPPLNQSGYQHKRNDSSSSRVIGATSLKTSSVQKNQILTSRSHSEQKALPNEKVYEAFRKREVQDIQKSSVLLSKVYYMLDNKCIAYKMECEVDYIMSFLTKKDETVRADALNILLKLCCNQEVANELMKDQNFHYLIEQCQFNKHEEVRSICFKIFGNLSNNQSKHVIKQLYYSSNLINKLPQIFAQEQSEDVLCSMFLFITKLTTDDIYLELITQEPELLAQILTYMNYKKNQRLRLLAYKVLINLLCIDEMRKVILKQTKLDVLAKLISIIDKGENTEDIIHALEALTNALQDYTVMVSFLQQKGHVSLAQVFEKEEIRIKEKCLALYTRLAQQRPEIPQGTPPLMMVVMDADLISDVLSLPLNEKKNIQVIRNMLLLIQVMLLGRNEQAVEQMKVFDIIYLLMNLVTGDTQLSYLALGCLSLLARRQDFKALILDKNLQGASVLQTISKGLTLLCASNNPQVLKFFIRSLHVYLLSFDRIEGDHLELDHIISLIQALTTAYECQEDMNGQYYAVLALKRLSEMGNQHISIIINSNEQLAQQLDDAPTLYRTQQEGFINDILEQDISKYLTYFATEDLEISGMNQQILFFPDLDHQQISSSQLQSSSKQTEQLMQQLTELKAKHNNTLAYLNDLQSDNARLEDELKRLSGVLHKNQKVVHVQTDLSQPIDQPPSYENPREVINRLKEDLATQNRMRKEAESKCQQMQERITDIEQDMAIRDKALQKLTQGTQMAEVIGSVKDRIREDMKHKFDMFQSTINTLQSVIDTNSKLIKDLTEAIQEKNIHNQALLNEDKVKQGKLGLLSSQIQTLESQVSDQQTRETQYRIQLDNLQQMIDPTLKQKMNQLPSIQQSVETSIIRELQQELIQIKVQNLKLQEEVMSLQASNRNLATTTVNLETDLENLKSQVFQGSQSSYIIKEIKRDHGNLDITIQRINEALGYIDRTFTRHNYKEELVNFYEDRLSRLTGKYEYLLIQHTSQSTHYHLTKVQLQQCQTIIHAEDNSQQSLTEFIQQQWAQSQRQLQRYEEQLNLQHSENKALKIKLQEIEGDLNKYRKIVLFDQSQYEKLFQIKHELPLTSAEISVLDYFSKNQEHNEFLRMNKILDIFMLSFTELEYELRKTGGERLRNEHHLIIEQKEMELREHLISQQYDFKITKLEHYVQLVQDDLRVLQIMNKEGNETARFLNDAEELLAQINQMLEQPMNETIGIETQDNFNRSIINEENKTTSTLRGTQANIAQGPKQRKVQVTNLVQVQEGKKPRIANDYNKKPKPQASLRFDQQRLEQLVREISLRIGQARSNLNDEQNLKARHASDSIVQIEILKESLLSRKQENQDLCQSIQRILLSKCQLANQLSYITFKLSQTPPITSQSESVLKLEGLLKVNTFLRRKDQESREELDLIKHKLEFADKERLAILSESRRLQDQVRSLQKVIKGLRESKRMTMTVREEGEAVPEDEIVQYLKQIEEANQKNSELEYMLQEAVQSNIEKDRLIRGSEDMIEQISTRLEQVQIMIENQIPVQIQQASQNKKKYNNSKKLPAMTGPDSVYERLKILLDSCNQWNEVVHNQITEIQRQKEIVESLRPENQTLTQAEHQAKLEKYLNIYSARIQTLSSIIASYQRHFKSLEDKLQETKSDSHKPSQSNQVDPLKRMLTLKDILIKHQQSEIESLKKTIVTDKFNDLLLNVTPTEKEALQKMRQFDMQVRVIEDYERQCLASEEVKKQDEYQYVKMINAKIDQDLIRIREVFSLEGEQATKKNSQRDESLKPNVEYSEYFERWLSMVKDMISSQFDKEKCKGYIDALNQEIPILTDIISQIAALKDDQKEQIGDSMEKQYIEAKFKELTEEVASLTKKLNTLKDRSNFLRSKNQQLQEQNFLLKKIMHTKKPLADEFKKFYKEDLIQENQYLRQRVLSLTPYSEKLSLECSILRQQLSDIQAKLLHQDERHLAEQVLFQTLEQTLLDTQRKYLEKDGEVFELLKQKRQLLFRGSSDNALELLLQTAESLKTESLKLREQNWQLELSLKQSQAQLEVKQSKIKESKIILNQYQERIRELLLKNERLHIISRCNSNESCLNQLGALDLSGISKEKLVYELGGKDGANYAIKFTESIAKARQEMQRMINDVQTYKIENHTLKMHVEDKSTKLHKLSEENEQLLSQVQSKQDEIEKLNYQNQRLQDDYLVQQQGLDVYIYMKVANQSGDQSNQHAFKKCIDNAMTLATLLSEATRQRTYYYTMTNIKKQEAKSLKEQLKVMKHKMQFFESRNELLESSRKQIILQEKISQRISSRYEKEVSIFNQFNQDTLSQGVAMLNQPCKEEQSPNKKILSVVDSPPQSLMKQIHGKSQDLMTIRNLSPRKLQFENQVHRKQNLNSDIHHFLFAQLSINEATINLIRLSSDLKSVKATLLHSNVLLNHLHSQNCSLQTELSNTKGTLHKFSLDFGALKLQNLYLSRWCLYLNRPSLYKVEEEINPDVTSDAYQSVSTLMSSAIDKLRFENKLLQDRNETLEDKIIKQESAKTPNLKVSQRRLLEIELQQQIEWNSRLEQEIVSKAAQIDALSKVHNDFSQVGNIMKAGTEIGGEQSLMIRKEYGKMEDECRDLKERLFRTERQKVEREVKIQEMADRIRDLEKKMVLQVGRDIEQCGEQQIKRKQRNGESEIQIQADRDEMWKKFAELNDLKNSLYDRNEDLRVEIDSFKTYFSKYEAQDFKKKLAAEGLVETFQNALYNELTVLRDERDLHLWQLNKQAQHLYQLRVTLESQSIIIPDLQSQLSQFESKEKSYLLEIANLKESILLSSGNTDNQQLLQLHEGNRLKRDHVALIYENAHLRRENEALRKEVQGSKDLQERVIQREYLLKRRLIEVKNELVKMRVREDMGEYNALIGTNSQKTPAKSVGTEENFEKVKIYVEDLTVMRESLLKIEFRNIELEELNSKYQRELDSLRQQVRDLQEHLRVYQNDDRAHISDPKLALEFDSQAIQIVDLQQRLLQEKWKIQKLQQRIDEQDPLVRGFQQLSDRHLDEVKEHQRINNENLLLKKQASAAGLIQGQSRGDIVFYDNLKEKFLNYLALYIEELKHKARQNLQLQEKNSFLQDRLVNLTIKIESFDQERRSYKLLIDQISRQKLQDIESDFFVTTQQHEEGLSKLEAHILNQRKQLSMLKSSLDTALSEKQLLEQNFRSNQQILANLERHSFEYNQELTVAKEEAAHLRGERDKYEQRITFMWDRLEFQDRLYNRVVANNASIEQVIKVYKEEISKIQRFIGSVSRQDQKVLKDDHIRSLSQSQILLIQADVIKLKNKEKASDEQLQHLSRENQLVKQHIRLAELLRMTVGVSQQERQILESKVIEKKEKIEELKGILALESRDREKLADRVAFLENQFNLKYGVGFVKAQGDTPMAHEDQQIVMDPRELSQQNQTLKKQNFDLEVAIQALKQQVHELTISLKYYDQSSLNPNSSHSTLKTQNSNRQARAVTPVRIRDMQLKRGEVATQRTARLSNKVTAQDNGNELYYGAQGIINLDQRKGGSREEPSDLGTAERHSFQSYNASDQITTKLPQIGGQNYAKPIDMKLKGNARNMTPLPGRPMINNSSQNQVPYSAQSILQNDSMSSTNQAIKVVSALGYTSNNRLNNKTVIGGSQSNYLHNRSLINEINFETMEPSSDNQRKY